MITLNLYKEVWKWGTWFLLWSPCSAMPTATIETIYVTSEYPQDGRWDHAKMLMLKWNIVCVNNKMVGGQFPYFYLLWRNPRILCTGGVAKTGSSQLGDMWLINRREMCIIMVTNDRYGLPWKQVSFGFNTLYWIQNVMYVAIRLLCYMMYKIWNGLL